MSEPLLCFYVHESLHPTIGRIADHEEPDLLRYTFPAKRGEITGLVVCLALRLCALSLNGGTILLWDFEARAGWMDDIFSHQQLPIASIIALF